MAWGTGSMIPIQRLKRRLTAWYVLLLAVVLLVYGATTYLAAERTFLDSLDAANRTSLGGVLAAFEREDESLDEVAHELSELALEPDQHVALLTASGRPVFERGVLFDPEPPLRPGAWTHDDREAYRVLVVPLTRGDTTRGYLRLARPTAPIRGTLSTLLISLAAGIPLVLLLAGVGGNWMATRAVKPIETAWERERRLTQDASHELRTPITVVLTHTELLLDKGSLPDAVREKLALIRATAKQMGELVEDLLVLGREDVGLGDRPLRWAWGDTVEEELAAIASMARSAGIVLQVDPLPEGTWVQGDPARVARAVRNLLQNAVRYTPLGGRVLVSLQSAGGDWALSVTNTAPPIPQEQWGRIFERFARGPDARTAYPEGSGLGLPIARAIARAHGGDLSLDEGASHPRFTLRLPKG